MLLVPLVALPWWGFFQQIILGQPWGSNPGPDWLTILLWLLIGVGLPIFFLYLRLIVTVTDESIEIHFRPLTRRTIQLSDISKVDARTYKAIREYGGWGIRGLDANKAYNVSGNRGVQLVLVDGRKVMIGSQRANDLELAITLAQST